MRAWGPATATLGLAAILTWGFTAAQADAPAAKKTPAQPDIAQVMTRGVDYLLASQRRDGSWGSPASNLHDIYAPPPGSQRAFQVGSLALALSALIESRDDRPEVGAAIDRAAAFLLKKYAVRRIRADTLYNTWALGYGLEALARLLAHERTHQRRPHHVDRLQAAARHCVKLLIRFEFVEGGWGYYNFSERTARPGPGATSFTTATNLVALMMAKAQGIPVPHRLVERSVRVIRRCERPDNSYYYGPDYIYYGIIGVNKIKGSLARTPTCLAALQIAGSPVTTAKFEKALTDLEKHGHFLRIARKYPIPHETWYQNSGYFCLYGYYYAAMCLAHVPHTTARTHAQHIAGHVAKMQEKDGSFWDYQLFNFHKAYGTGYAVMILRWCLDQAARER